jgi:hypothetical protein
LSIDTLKAGRQVDSECLAVEVMSGGDVKASPRHPEKRPQELKAQEGIEWLAGLTPLLAATDRCSDQSPEAEVGRAGTGGATRQEVKLGNGKRAWLIDEVRRLSSEETP